MLGSLDPICWPFRSPRQPQGIANYTQKNCHFITYTTYFEGFERKGAAEVCMGVLRILFNHCIEILHSLIMLIDHLIRFGSLVEEPQITGDRLEALLEGED